MLNQLVWLLKLFISLQHKVSTPIRNRSEYFPLFFAFQHWWATKLGGLDLITYPITMFLGRLNLRKIQKSFGFLLTYSYLCTSLWKRK